MSSGAISSTGSRHISSKAFIIRFDMTAASVMPCAVSCTEASTSLPYRLVIIVHLTNRFVRQHSVQTDFVQLQQFICEYPYRLEFRGAKVLPVIFCEAVNKESAGRSPRDEGEQMSLNNYLAMDFLRQHAQADLSMEMLFELHSILTHRTLDAHQIGQLRQPSDRIEVASLDGVVVHTPPHADELETRMHRLLAFANHDDEGRDTHPFIKAVALHFMIGYDHPFVDGNGRTERALFYWSMARSGYWLTQYLTISSVIRQAPAQYVRAYAHSETDDIDITYFVYYNLQVMREAVSNLQSYLAGKSRDMERLWNVLSAADSMLFLNHRQVALLGHLLKNPDQTYVIASHQRSHNVTYQTARTDLIGLTEFGFLQASKRGRKLVYRKSSEFESKLESIERGAAQ